MRFFLNNHPYLSTAMLGMVCLTIVKTVKIIANDDEGINVPFLKKKKNDDKVEE